MRPRLGNLLLILYIVSIHSAVAARPAKKLIQPERLVNMW